MKTPSFSPFLVLLLIVFLLGGVLYLSVLPGGPLLTVTTSKGSSGLVSGGVLLPGDSVRTGDRIRVVSASLTGVLAGDSPSRVRLEPGSLVRHRGAPNGSHSVWLSVERGSGLIEVNEHRVVLDLGPENYLINGGTVRWDRERGSDTLQLVPGTRVYRIDETGGTTAVAPAKYTVTTLSRRWPESPHPLEDYEEYSVIWSGRKVIDTLLERSRNGPVPESLLDVFGHWVRDRWGNVYLYERSRGGLRLRSAGPDEGLFTGDDLTWSGGINR